MILILKSLLSVTKKNGKILTLTAVKPSGRFGALEFGDDGSVQSFQEKPKGDGAWINGGFMVCEPELFNYIDGSRNDVILERGPLEALAAKGELNAYKHYGFWKPMDTLKDKTDLTNMWENNSAPWALWLNKEVEYV